MPDACTMIEQVVTYVQTNSGKWIESTINILFFPTFAEILSYISPLLLIKIRISLHM